MEEHKKKVLSISSRVRQFYEKKKPFRIYHGSTTTTRQISHRREDVVDTSLLDSVICVDSSAKTALVEPNVSMECLVEHTLKYKLLPPVVMEFTGITVGGGFAGASGESSSFRYGLFCETVRSIEIVLGNGDIVRATPTNPETMDLFHEVAGSCGTFGVVTLLELRLIDSKDYVRLSYKPTRSPSEALEIIHDAVNDDSIDFIDGIIYSRDFGTVMTGRLTDRLDPSLKVQRFTRARDPWLYLHAKKISKCQLTSQVDILIPIRDYLFRYDRGGFWSGAVAFKYFYVPFNRITRWVLDKYMRTRVMMHALHSSGVAKEAIIQDLTIPYHAADEFINYIVESTRIFPLWLCPIRGISPGSKRCFAHGKATTTGDVFVNVGVWGFGPKNETDNIALNREIEQKVNELDGVKILYARTYYTEDEFWEIYDEKKYLSLREKYHATLLPSVYEKVRTLPGDQGRQPNESVLSYFSRQILNTWPFGALYGVLMATLGGEYLISK